MAFAPCYVLVLAALTFWSPKLMSCCVGLGSTAVSCSGLAWWIAGMVWRLNQAGSLASGDEIPTGVTGWDGQTIETQEQWAAYLKDDQYTGPIQISSGNFMYVYLLITWILMGTACGCSIIGALVACMCK